jgi:pyruvate dehydrogenase E1 component
VKGYGMGLGEAQNKTHQIKKLDIESLKEFRDRFDMPFTDEELHKVPYYRPQEKSNEMRYLMEKRKALGGFVPQRLHQNMSITVPALGLFAPFFQGSGDRQLSTTMGFVRMLSALIKVKDFGERIVPIVPDEARTFGMEGMFKQLGIYSSVGQLYEPEDAGQAMFYREDKEGRILEAGINEAGAMSAWIAAATSYSNNRLPMVPFYIFYSMFGFQRIGDLAWAAGDIQARGFLMGATAGRTTLNGEGLQHQDGHSHLLASTIPNCVAYDPCFNHELAVILHDGLERMFTREENVFYYLTLMNENYTHPAYTEDEIAHQKDGIIKGMYLLKESESTHQPKVQLLGSGTILREVIAASEILFDVYGVMSDIWSVTSYSELRREGLHIERWNLLHPMETKKEPYVTACFKVRHQPVIAVSDYMKIVSDQIRPFVRNHFTALGTDGFGRSDTRENLRKHFEVDRYYIVVAALTALADKGIIGRSKADDAIKRFEIDPEKIDPQKA